MVQTTIEKVQDIKALLKNIRDEIDDIDVDPNGYNVGSEAISLAGSGITLCNDLIRELSELKNQI